MPLCCPLVSHKAAHSCLSGKSRESVGFPLLTPCFDQLLQRAESSRCSPPRGPHGSGSDVPAGSCAGFYCGCLEEPAGFSPVPAARPLRSGQVTALARSLLLSL